MINQHRTLASLDEAKQFYIDEVAKRKTNASMKSFLTRSIKKQEDYLKDITEAVQRGHKDGKAFGWYLGETFTSHHVRFYTKELEMMKQMRSAIL